MQKIPPKRSITNAHATKEQKLRKAVSPNRAVFDFGGLFLLLFWAGKKVKNKIFKKTQRKKSAEFPQSLFFVANSICSLCALCLFFALFSFAKKGKKVFLQSDFLLLSCDS